MKTELFDFELPEDLIARYPADRRSDSRMLRLDRKTGEVSHHLFRELPDLLSPGDLVVGNDTRVFPARIYAEREGGGQSELLLLEQVSEPEGLPENLRGAPGECWRVLARGAKRLSPGKSIKAPGASVTALARDDDKVILRIAPEGGKSVLAWAEKVGEIPLPPYMNRRPEKMDLARYQTVFADEPGSVAAPTAGLHFDDEVIANLRGKDIGFETLRLHVGWGTFAPIRGDDIHQHHLDEERYEISPELAEKVRQTKGADGARVVAVGTTVTRSLETAFASEPPVLSGRSRLYITPGYRFRAIDALITNFHLPRTSLLVLVSAFAGREHVLEAYRQAVADDYRFYSYGDCMLII